jgi:hypothetical protein
VADTKVCSKCFVEKSITEFWITDKTRGYRRGPCKECDKAYQRSQYADKETFRVKAKANSRKWAKANPRSTDTQRRYQIKAKYGITHEEYLALFESQGNACGLCKSTDSGRKSGKWANGYFHIDHDHATGRVRGLLCHKCNVRVGAYEGLMADVGEDCLMRYLHPERGFTAAELTDVIAEFTERYNA